MEKVVICIIAPEAVAGGRALAAGRVGIGGNGMLGIEPNVMRYHLCS